MADKTVKSVRDFIYLDIPRLYSVYSQVFEGVSDQIMKERIEHTLSEYLEDSPKRHASNTSQEGDVSREVESGFLHHHMYSRLEAALVPALWDATQSEPPNMAEHYSMYPVVKVSGRAEVEDYERVQQFISKFNDIGDAIAYSNVTSEPLKGHIAALKQQLERNPPPAKKKELQDAIKHAEDTKRIANEQGLSQDLRTLKNLVFFTQLFNPTGYDVVVTPHREGAARYRAVLNRAWLVDNPDLLRSLYGGQSELPWTVVGYVSYVPGTFTDLREQETAAGNSEIIQKYADIPSMRDAFRGMFLHERAFERAFIESYKSVEVVLSPLAIYREVRIPEVAVEWSE